MELKSDRFKDAKPFRYSSCSNTKTKKRALSKDMFHRLCEAKLFGKYEFARDMFVTVISISWYAILLIWLT